MTIYHKIGKESIQWAHTLNNIGILYSDQGKLDEALESYNKALTIHQKIGKESIHWANTFHNIGVVYNSQGKLE